MTDPNNNRSPKTNVAAPKAKEQSKGRGQTCKTQKDSGDPLHRWDCDSPFLDIRSRVC